MLLPMAQDYRYELLPLETPDTDPVWHRYLDVFRIGLVDHPPVPAFVDFFRTHRRVDQSRLGMITTSGPGLADGEPVAAFSDCVTQINVGAESIPVLVINWIAVKPSHRRRGLLKRMMREHLDAARERDIPLALLEASEGAIYARFGFGATTRSLRAELDTRRLRWRDGVSLAQGSVEFVAPTFLTEHFRALTDAHHRHQYGAMRPLEMHRLMDLGQWDSEDKAPSQKLRAVVHFDPSGQPDGYALFSHGGWDTPVTATVQRVVAADAAVSRSLWDALASMDIVERLTYLSHPGDPLPLSLADEWAVKITGGTDRQWLRILDLPAAIAGRGFDGEGELTVGISDPLGYADGVWRIAARDGVGSAELTAATPEVRLGVDALARLWFGDRTAEELAVAGHIHGDDTALRQLSSLFRSGRPAFNHWKV